MKILFAGSSEFSLPTLQMLQRETDLVLVLTREDKPAGRNLSLSSTCVKAYAREQGLPIVSSESPEEEIQKRVEESGAELLVCASYGKIFRKKFLDLFPRGSVNVHPSLLPRHRGPSPILASLLEDRTTGVSLQKISLEMDKGDILLQSKRDIQDDSTLSSLQKELAEDGAQLVQELLKNYQDLDARAQKQNDADASYTLKYNSLYGHIMWAESANRIARMTRAFSAPLSGVKARYKNEILKIWKAQCVPQDRDIEIEQNGANDKDANDKESAKPGTVLGIHQEYGIIVRTVRGYLGLQELQREYKKKLFWREFIAGQRNFIGEILK